MLPRTVALESRDKFRVSVVAPEEFSGDMGRIQTDPACDGIEKVHCIPVSCDTRIHWMRYGKRLKQLMQHDVDLIHCWEEPYILAGFQIARWTPAQVPLVFASFQNIHKNYPPPFCWFERHAMRRASGWIAFGHTVKEALMRKECYQNLPHRVITPGVDVEQFRPDPTARTRIRSELQWNDEAVPVIGFLGRFVREKGVERLMARLDKLSIPWRALFVGGGELEPQLREWSKARPNEVRIVTGVKHHEVPAYLNAMDLLCAPSLTTPKWREQFGRMLIEAMASGVPIVASDSGEIPFTVGDAAQVVKESDDKAWVNAITSLLRSTAERARLSAAGRARAESEFAWSIIARRHIDFFHEILAGRTSTND